MSEKPEDYYIQGYFMKVVAGEDLEFLDWVELRSDMKVYLLKDDSENNYLFKGQVMASIKEEESGDVMINGIIIPREDSEDYLKIIRRGAMMEIFSAIGEAFGFEVRPSEPKANHFPNGWFTHSCRYLLEDIKCDLGLKDRCEYTTNDQKCGLLVRRLAVANEELVPVSKPGYEKYADQAKAHERRRRERLGENEDGEPNT